MASGPNTQLQLERHFQTLIGAIALALLGWVFLEVQKLTVETARQNEQLATLSSGVSLSLKNQYTSRDAARDFSIRDEDIRELRTMVDRLESRMDKVEGPSRHAPQRP